MDVITISLGRGILERGSREYERMRAYARHLTSLHIIVLTREEHGFTEPIHDGSLHIYPTNTRTRFGMLVRAFCIGRMILREGNAPSFVVSAQDPLEIGWLSFLLACMSGAHFHVQMHGDHFGGAWTKGSLVRKVRLFFARILLRHAPAIRVVSERIKASLIEAGIQEEKVTVLPIRPELESFCALPRQGRHDPFTFLYIGRLAPEKDVRRIVRAFALVSQMYPDVRLRIVGKGSEEGVVRACIETYGLRGVVDLVPWTEDVPKEMASADVLVLASLHEAYGLVLVEAMAAGLPCVATDVGCVGEVFKDREHGLVVREDGDAPFAEAMQYLYEHDDLRKEWGIQAQEAAKRLMSVSPEEYVASWVTSVRKSVE